MKNELGWGLKIESTHGNFLLGANINIGNWNGDKYGYLCIYLGFRTLVIGRDVF